MDIRKDIKEAIVVVLIAAALIFFLNLEYFWKNILYYFRDFRSPTVEQAKQAEKSSQAELEPNTLIIESLDIQVPVQYVSEVSETAFQKALQDGVVHYPGTAKPGEPGNVYIFGHSSDNAWSKGHYKTVFAVLPKIQKGAAITITDSEGRVYKYLVTDSQAASSQATEYLSQETKGKKILTLQTSYPVGTSFKRWIVRAELGE